MHLPPSTITKLTSWYSNTQPVRWYCCAFISTLNLMSGLERSCTRYTITNVPHDRSSFSFFLGSGVSLQAVLACSWRLKQISRNAYQTSFISYWWQQVSIPEGVLGMRLTQQTCSEWVNSPPTSVSRSSEIAHVPQSWWGLVWPHCQGHASGCWCELEGKKWKSITATGGVLHCISHSGSTARIRTLWFWLGDASLERCRSSFGLQQVHLICIKHWLSYQNIYTKMASPLVFGVRTTGIVIVVDSLSPPSGAMFWGVAR